MLARNCDLCWLASSSCRLLSWISSNSRTFSIAIAAWSAKAVTSSICLSVNGLTVVRVTLNIPIGTPSRRIGQNIDYLNGLALEQNPTKQRSPSLVHRHSLIVILNTGREAVGSYDMVVSVFLASDRRDVRHAKP